MNEKKEKIFNYLSQVAEIAKIKLQEREGYDNYEIVDVVYSGEVELTDRETGEKTKVPRITVIAADPERKQEVTKFTYVGFEEIDNELIRKYEIAEPIRDEVGEKSQEEEERYSLKELKEEKENEEKSADIADKKKEEKEGTAQNKKRKPSYVIERINPDKAKMDYWKTIKQAFNLPPEVDTLAFSYPVSSEDKVDYANITIYMLDKDGYILDDYKIDDYFAFDASTGNNPMQDDTVRHEKDENKGKAQIDGNNTMIRLMAKKANDKNSYISLEQKNGSIDYNDINAGKKVVGGTQNVEHQLETDRFRVRDAEVEKMVRSNAGRYNMNEILSEAKEHENHGDKGYINTKNADGNKTTRAECDSPFIPGTDKTWKELSEETGEGIEKLQERFEREAVKEKDPEKIIKIIESDYDRVERTH